MWTWHCSCANSSSHRRCFCTFIVSSTGPLYSHAPVCPPPSSTFNIYCAQQRLCSEAAEALLCKNAFTLIENISYFMQKFKKRKKNHAQPETWHEPNIIKSPEEDSNTVALGPWSFKKQQCSLLRREWTQRWFILHKYTNTVSEDVVFVRHERKMFDSFSDNSAAAKLRVRYKNIKYYQLG